MTDLVHIGRRPVLAQIEAMMSRRLQVFARSSLFRGDFDYHLLRASMVIIFLKLGLSNQKRSLAIMTLTFKRM